MLAPILVTSKSRKYLVMETNFQRSIFFLLRGCFHLVLYTGKINYRYIIFFVIALSKSTFFLVGLCFLGTIRLLWISPCLFRLSLVTPHFALSLSNLTNWGKLAEFWASLISSLFMTHLQGNQDLHWFLFLLFENLCVSYAWSSVCVLDQKCLQGWVKLPKVTLGCPSILQF